MRSTRSFTFEQPKLRVGSFDFETKRQGSDWGNAQFSQKHVFSADLYLDGQHYTLCAGSDAVAQHTWASTFLSLNAPDVLWVGHNIRSYDIPGLRALTQSLQLKGFSIEIPGRVLNCDTLKDDIRRSGWGSKSLGSQAYAYGIKQKGSVPNYLWEAAYEGDKKAQAYVDEYCKNDTEVQVALYNAKLKLGHLKNPYGKVS